MSSSLDLNILPLARKDGQDISEIPGLHAVTPPRRTARGRSSDSLIIYLTLAGNAPISAEGYRELFPRLTRVYYKTSGSATAAMRALAEELNQFLLERNLRSSSAGRQAVGLLVLAALRGNALYLSHCGPVHSYLIAPDGTQHMYDPDMSERGLGLSRTTKIRYYQTNMNPGDHLVFTPLPPAGWTQETLRPARHGLSGMRRRLLDHASPNLSAVVIQAQAGTGKLRLLRLKTGIEDMAQMPQVEAPQAGEELELEAGQPSPPIPAPDLTIAAPEEEPQATLEPQRGESPRPWYGDPLVTFTTGQQAQPELPGDDSVAPIEDKQAATTSRRQHETIWRRGKRRDRSIAPAVSTPPPAGEKVEEPRRPPKTRRPLPKINLAPILSVLGAIGRALDNTLGIIGRGLLGLLKNVLPDESVLRLPPSLIIFLAVAIPLLVSIIGGTVYVRRGRAAQHQNYYEQALTAAAQARAQTETDNIRAAWKITLGYLDQAEFYAVTDQSAALRGEAITALDELDGVVRLDFQPAIGGGLGDNVHITQMVATASDLYMLDSQQGTVKRAFLTGRGYEIDTSFICGPSFGQTIIGKLVDIVSLPSGFPDNATLLGMDAGANLTYCIPEGVQPVNKQIAPPSTNFGEPVALTLDMGDLYLLDPPVNAVWIYRNHDTAQQPRFFFGDDIPPMQDVIDLAVNNDDLYLLHSDGHITTCIYSGFEGSPTRCEEPATYIDPRSGRENGTVISDALFNQIYFSPPPDPSMYMLDPGGQAIYHFSLRLAFQRQFRSIDPLPEGSATAFAVSPNRTVFLAIGNQVFYAALP